MTVHPPTPDISLWPAWGQTLYCYYVCYPHIFSLIMQQFGTRYKLTFNMHKILPKYLHRNPTIQEKCKSKTLSLFYPYAYTSINDKEILTKWLLTCLQQNKPSLNDQKQIKIPKIPVLSLSVLISPWNHKETSIFYWNILRILTTKMTIFMSSIDVYILSYDPI